MRQIMSKLYREDPYAALDTVEHAPDMQGWGYDDAVFGQAIISVQPSLIVEVGSWKGMSALRMARIVKALGLDCEIVCVDTWLGSPEHLMADQESWYQSLRFKNGFPQLFYTFMSNVMQAGMQDIITPFPATSENAAYILDRWGVRADLVYIDAAHEYAPAKADFERYWPLLSDRGLMLCDDYVDSWPGVIQAVTTFVDEKGITDSHFARPGKAVMAKTKHPAFDMVQLMNKPASAA